MEKGLIMNRHFMIWIAALCLAGCSYDHDKKVLELVPVEQKIVSPGQITYKVVNQSIFEAACLSCHSSSGGNKGGINLEDFESVTKNIGMIRKEVSGKTMPPSGGLSDAQIKLLTDWIDAGAHEHGSTAGEVPTPAPAPMPVPALITFAKIQSEVLKTNCLQCHSELAGSSGDVNLESYKNVFAKKLQIKAAVESGRMPTSDGTPLTAEQKELILKWIAQGSPE